MAEIKLDLGATLDLVTGEEFANGMAKLTDFIDEKLDKQKSHASIRRFLNGSLVAVGTGDQTIKVGTPASGKRWDVRTMVVWTVDLFTLGGNTRGAVTVGTPGDLSSIFGVTNGETLPFTWNWGQGQNRVSWHESLGVIIHAPVDGQLYGVNVTLIEARAGLEEIEYF